MNMRQRIVIVALFAMLAPAAPADAQGPGGSKYGELMKRIPAQANALLLVDVDGLFNSKLGVRERWKDQSRAAHTTGVIFPANVSRLVIATHLDLHDLETAWQVGMGEMIKPPNLGALARQENGFQETLQNTRVVWSPRNLYFFAFPPKILGFVTPADRQAMTGWIQRTLIQPRDFAPGWADRAVNRADRASQIALALNLEDAIAPELAEKRLGTLEQVDPTRHDLPMMAKVLASARSLTASVEVGEAITGSLRIEFAMETTYIKPFAKLLVLTALQESGADLPDLQKWTSDVTPHAITLSGTLTKESVRRILSLIRPPHLEPAPPSYGSTPPKAPAQPAPPDQPTPPTAPATQPPAVLAQSYFHAVIDLLDGLKQQKSSTYQSMQLWYNRYAKRIDELPILGVDKDLLDWGGQISQTLRQMAGGINYTKNDQSYRISSAGSTGYAYGGYGYYGGESKATDAAIIKRQSNAMLDTKMTNIWGQMDTSIAEMRRKMVERYQVDF